MRVAQKLFRAYEKDQFTEVRDFNIVDEIITFVLNSIRYNADLNYLNLPHMINIIIILRKIFRYVTIKTFR